MTTVRVPLPHWSSQSRPCRHLRPRLRAGFRVPDYYLAAFAQFPNKRLIAVGKFVCNVKYYLFMFSNLLFRVPQCNRRDTFLCAFVKRLAVFRLSHCLCSGECCRRLYLQDGDSAAAPRPARGQSGVAGSGGEGLRLSTIVMGRLGVRSLTLSFTESLKYIGDFGDKYARDLRTA